MNRKKLWFFVLTTVILTSFISGCIGGGQFGAPSADSSVTIKGVVVAPDNNCFTDTCANPSIIEGDPLPNADIILKGDTHTLIGKTDCAGNYQISGLADDGYVLYANRGEVWIKKAISPVTGDGGQANYLTTAQVILWEVIESSSPGSIPIKDIPTVIPFDGIPQNFIDAVKAALADCRDAQQDKTVIGLAKTFALANFGAPCAPCVEGTPGSTPCVCPTPTPDCPIGVAEAVISYEKIEGLTYRFDASDSKPQTGSYPILTYNWVISEGGTKNRGKNGSGIVCQSDQKIFDCTLPKSGSYLINLTVATECESNSSQVALSTLGPRLLIKKVVVPEDPSSSWSFSLEGPNEFKTSFTLNSSNNWEKEFLPTDVPSLEPGQYTIIENEKSGYDCISIDIDGVSSPTIDLPNWKATFTLQSTANVTVTFTNEKQEEKPASLTIKKELAAGSAPPGTSWNFTLSGPNGYSKNDISLPANGGEVTLNNLKPGQYTVTETPQAGYECTKIEVSVPANIELANQKATFDLVSNVTVTVTFTNKEEFISDNIQDILIVDPPTSPSAGTLGFVKIIGWGSDTYVKVQYRLLNGSLSSDLGAWCIELNSDLIFGIEYKVKFYPAVDSNPPLYDSMSNVWGIINYGKNKGYNKYAIQNEIWHITDGLNHNYIFDDANPDDSGEGIVCIPVQ